MIIIVMVIVIIIIVIIIMVMIICIQPDLREAEAAGGEGPREAANWSPAI